VRKDVIGKGLSIDAQDKLAKEKGVVVMSLPERIWANFTAESYLDRSDPCTYARTSMRCWSRALVGIVWSIGCGNGGPFGLDVNVDFKMNEKNLGMAVAIRADV
jgi:hypothetical protein